MGLKDLFKKKPKKEDTPEYRRQMAERLAGKHIKYVSERIEGIEEIIGREGALNLRDGEFIVFCAVKGGHEVLFRAKVEELSAWELLSLEGVVLTAPDIEHGGEVRTIIAYYKYYL
ncbi:MAG: hypothetical protein J6D21_02540 [Clostridia bacterium]|nr:hypothetical protein [Clostridia bacterium]